MIVLILSLKINLFVSTEVRCVLSVHNTFMVILLEVGFDVIYYRYINLMMETHAIESFCQQVCGRNLEWFYLLEYIANGIVGDFVHAELRPTTL